MSTEADKSEVKGTVYTSRIPLAERDRRAGV